MAFRNWRVGMHIQQDHIAIVALLHERTLGASPLVEHPAHARYRAAGNGGGC